MATCPLPAMGTAQTSGSWRRWFSWGPCLSPVVSLSRSPGLSAARLSTQALPRSPASWQDCPSLLKRPRLVPLPEPGTWSLQVGPRPWGVQSPFCKPPSDWTARGPGLGSSSSRRDAVREEGRWGSSDVARLPLPLPVPAPGFLPSPARSPPAIPDQWAQTQGGGPSPGQAGRSVGVQAWLNGGAGG